MRRALLAGLSLLVLLGGGTALLLQDDDRAPLPSEDQLRIDGFAVWPEDTLAEGMDSCEEAESWRLDPKETAFRFTREVLRYPDPSLNTDPIIDEERTAETIRYLIGTRGVRGVFLGSVVDVRKYDRCWFVVRLDPREGGWLPSVGFAHGGSATRVVLTTNGSDVELGFGSWKRRIAQSAGQIILDVPDLQPDTTGHIMALSKNQQVYDGSAAPLGAIPEAATSRASPATLDKIMEVRGICRRDDAYRDPNLALAVLYTFTFDSPVSTSGRHVIFRKGDGAKHISGDRWLLRRGEAELKARIPNLRPGCWRVLFLAGDQPQILKTMKVESGWLTFELRWANAMRATITVSTPRGGNSWTFERVNEPLTVRNYKAWLLKPNEPFEVTVVLRDEHKLMTAERAWREV